MLMNSLLSKASEEPKVLRMMQEEAISRGYAAVSPKKIYTRHGKSQSMLSNSTSLSSLYKRNNFYQDRVAPIMLAERESQHRRYHSLNSSMVSLP